MSKRVGLFVIIFLVLLVVLAGAYYYKYSQQGKQSAKTQAPVSHVSPTVAPTASLPIVPHDQGIIQSISPDTLTIATNSATTNYNTSKLYKVYKVIPHGLEQDEVASSSASELRVGQEIYIIADSNSQVISITILK